jgi:hypothetical protein
MVLVAPCATSPTIRRVEMSDDGITRQDAEAKALALARQSGREAAEVEARLVANEREIDYIRKAVGRVRDDLGLVASKVDSLDGTFSQHLAVGKAIATQVKENSDNQVSKKTYILGLVGTVIALGMLLIATVALLYGANH